MGVSVDRECDLARAMVESRGVDWPQLCDGQAMEGPFAKAYEIRETPAYFVIAPDGTLLGSTAAADELERILARAFADGTPAG